MWNWPSGEGSNYYDVVAGFYALYYRSGIDDYLTAARTLADREWKYKLDSGMKCYYGPGDRCGSSIPARVQSTLGMVLRAMDGRPDMWPGLENIFTYYVSFLRTEDPAWGLWDIREEAYHMAIVSYCALYDPNSTYRANCRSALSYAMDHL